MSLRRVVAFDAVTLVLVAVTGSIVAFFSALVGRGADAGTGALAESANRNYSDDPVYKNKPRELLERNKKFEEERSPSSSASLASNG